MPQLASVQAVEKPNRFVVENLLRSCMNSSVSVDNLL